MVCQLAHVLPNKAIIGFGDVQAKTSGIQRMVDGEKAAIPEDDGVQRIEHRSAVIFCIEYNLARGQITQPGGDIFL